MHPRSANRKKPGRPATSDNVQATSRSLAPPPEEAGETEWVVIAANDYIVSHYPIGFLAGTPRRLELSGRELWIVPIVLTSPGYGAVGEVGVVALGADTRQALGCTPRSEVVAAARRLREEKHDDLEAAFHRARTR